MTNALEVVKRFVDEYQTSGNVEVAEELLAADFVDHTPFSGFGPSREDVKQLFVALRTAFPDLRAEIAEQYANGDMVATRKTFYGTHQGPFLGTPATGKSVTIRVMDFVRVKGGKMSEHWNVVDVPALIAQLSS